MTEKQGFMTALYERLSRDDELNGESNSMSVTGKEALRQHRKWKSILTSLADIYRHILVR